jgi:DNA-binding transcriptional MerR regulator
LKVQQELTKLYYSISEVADMFDVSNSLIRYWESEFTQLKPQKNRRGDRKFTSKDIQTLEVIYTLLKEKGYTIEGANKILRTEISKAKQKEGLIKMLENVKSGLVKLKDQI